MTAPRAGQIRLGDVICYEVGFDRLVASEVTAGANLLAVQCSDATSEVDGQTGETGQLAMGRI
jgi:apolipoprotein N-acyltransferase